MTSVLALQQFLPDLQPDTCHSVLSERQRDRLYQLLMLPLMVNQDRYGINEVQEELLRTAQRLGDTRALGSIRKIAFVGGATPAIRRISAMARETLRILEAQVEKEKESRTLLRGASSPAGQPHELLRAAAPAEATTAPNELLRASNAEQERAPFKVELPEESKVALLRQMEDRRF
jgi:hypothetical protein